MRSERFDEVERAFLSAREVPPEFRDAILDRQGLDHEVRALVEKLLAYDESPDDPFVTPALGRDFSVPPPESFAEDQGPRPERRIGEYRLLEVLAVGGMGVVYRAEQSSPRRDVALKLLRSTDPSREGFARFRAEAEILGRLQHPSIAQIFEAGSAGTEAGERPYLVMELVQGCPLDEFVAEHAAGLRERVALLVQVCDAVHHAHERNVLHCDLKPDNVLVDRSGLPKVIDFGVGRLLDERGADPGNAGTLAFLSPEQLPGSRREPDRRSDVYALGLCLHHLATAVPISGGPPGGGARDAAHPALRGARFVPLGLPRSAEDPDRDLDAILRRATQPDPAARHQSAHELAEDLRAYLRHRPVRARAGGPVYRLRKAVRRHRREALVALACLLTMIAAFAIGWRSRELLQAERTRVADALRTRDQARDRATRIQDYLVSLLSAAGPLDLGPEASLAALIERVSAQLDTAFVDDPELEVAIRTVLSELHRLHGDLEASEREVLRAHERAVAALGEDDPAAQETLQLVGNAALERGDLEAAEACFRRLLVLSETMPEGSSPATGHALAALAGIFQGDGRFDEARSAWRAILASPPGRIAPTYRDYAAAHLGHLDGDGDPRQIDRLLGDALEGTRRLYGASHPYTLRAAILRQVHRLLSELDIPGARRALEALWTEACETLGVSHPETLNVQHHVARALDLEGQHARAVAVATEVLRRRRARLGDAHPDTLESWNNLGRYEQNAGLLLQAREHFEGLVEVALEALPENHWTRGMYLGNLGEVQRKTGRFVEARVSLDRALAEMDSLPGADALPVHLRCMVLGVCSQRGLLGIQMGEPAVALPYLRRVHVEHVELHGARHPHALAAAQNLAEALAAVGRTQEAVELFEETLRHRRAVDGPTGEGTLLLLRRYARWHVQWSRGDEVSALCESLGGTAEERGILKAEIGKDLVALAPELARALLFEGLETCEEALGSDSPRILGWKHALGVALVSLDELEEAEFLWREVLAAREEVLGRDDPGTLDSLECLGACLLRAERPEEALEVLDDLLARSSRRTAGPPPRLYAYEGRRGQALFALRRWEEARRVLEGAAHALFESQGPTARAPFLEDLRAAYRLQGRDPAAELALLADS